MKFLLAPDSFKESMSANQVCQAMKRGILKAIPDAQIIAIPMADGGEGTTDALVKSLHGKYLEKIISGPLNKPVKARYGLINQNQTAVIEVAEAVRLNYIPQNLRSPQTIKNASTYGVGELIIDAISHGAKRIIIGLGGSCSNDGGCGMAQALGVQFFDQNQQLLTQKLAGGDLKQICSIDNQKIDPRVKKTNIILLVTSPIL